MTNRSSTILTFVMVGVALLGFTDASYLVYKHYRHVIPPCSVVSGCEMVTTSAYSVVLGVPVALAGSLYYASIILGLALYHVTKRPLWLLKTISIGTVVGFAASVWFVFLQLFVIKAICLYCMFSAASSTILFICGIVLTYRWIRMPVLTSFRMSYE